MESPSRWNQIKEIVGTAIERHPAQRAAYLDAVCALNPSLRCEVESLISAYDQAPDNLSLSAISVPLLTDVQPFQSIGPYRLLKVLGEGGMGQVWLAEQTSPVRRQVALKLIRSGMLHPTALQRFQSERQSLATMDHPGIAKVFDAGATPGGHPYFVMEYVEGLPITTYCDQKKLSVPDRLQLFIQVCEAVQHAHRKAIIHRDLKPPNILVVEIDGKPRPRIIDFGLAKAVAPPSPGETLFTQVGALLGTPGYMSPEQIDPSVQDVDTRADVYSLGVVLYELLTGALPFDTQQLKKQPIDKVLRMLREQDPPSPSTRVSTDRQNSSISAQLRGLHPAELASLLRGDLDWITLKALERDRDRRYGSPSELAADIERFLQNRPVIARPASAYYRLRKYIGRNRVAVAVASGALALLIAFAITEAIQLRRVTRERDRANRITEFMTSMFKVADPNEARGNSITAREILDKSSKEIETGLSRDPQLQAQLMGTMGQVYVSMGLFPQAQSMLERAIETGRHVGGPNDPDALRAMSHLSFLLLRQGRYADAEKLFKEAIPGQQRVFGPNDPTTLNTRRYLASVLEFEGKYAEADSVMTAVLADDRRALGPENAETLRAMNVMANILDDEKRLPEAEKLYRETLEIQKRTLGPDAPETLTSASNLAGALQELGRLDEAEKLQRDTLAARTHVLGPDHPDTLAVKANLANTLDSGSRFAEAETLYHEVLDVQARVLGKDNPDTLVTAGNLGSTLQRDSKLAEAEKLQRSIFEAKRRVLGPDHPETVKTLDSLAATLFIEGHDAEARKIYSDRIAGITKQPGQPGLGGAWYDFACGAALAHHPDEAFELLQHAIDSGYLDFENTQSDRDLQSLRSDPRFDSLLTAMKQKSPTTSK
ncbi:MAG TPA: serine/threonine-protein kinase [Candidatus Acidoferrum sp.]